MWEIKSGKTTRFWRKVFSILKKEENLNGLKAERGKRKTTGKLTYFWEWWPAFTDCRLLTMSHTVRAADTLSWVEPSARTYPTPGVFFFSKMYMGQLSLHLELGPQTACQSCLPRPPSRSSFTSSCFILHTAVVCGTVPVSMYMYMYIHTYTSIYIKINTPIYVYSHIKIYSYVCIYIKIYVCVYIYLIRI